MLLLFHHDFHLSLVLGHTFNALVYMRLYMRRSRILQSMQHTQGDTKERELLKCVVAVKECIRGG